MNNWIKYFTQVGLPLELIQEYEIYIQNLEKNNVPIIFEINHLALLLGVKINFLNKIIYSPQNFYRQFEIPKKSGGNRKIIAPYPSLLLIQKWILSNILNNIPINGCAHAFTSDKSIISNCKQHLGNKEILKLDLKDFFPSIEINRIVLIFNKLGYSENISYILANLCCLNGILPQGAPTSPILSNLVCRKLDKRLLSLAKQFNLKYTRYADDIVFSGEKINVKIMDYVQNIIINEGFEINKDKTRLYKEKNKKIITGISVSDTLKLPRNYKRNLVLELNYILKFGYTSHISKKKIRDINHLPSIIGKVNFWLQIEPKNEFALKAKKYLLEEFKKRINYT